MAKTDAPPAFWFCRRCGTPNPAAKYLTECIGCGEPRPADAPKKRRPAPQKKSTSRQESRTARWTRVACWAYAGALLALLVLLRALGERWWLATALLYGPRWFAALPLLLLIPTAVVANRRALLVLAVGAAIVAGPLMGLCIPWRSWTHAATGKRQRIRVLTCNVHYANVHPEDLYDLIAAEQPDIVALQEWSIHHDAPAAKLWPGLNVHIEQETCLVSQFPIEKVEALDREQFGGKGNAVHYILQVPGGPVHFFNLHPISARDGLEAVINDPLTAAEEVGANSAIRWRESEVASSWASQVQGRVLLAGDLNLPSDSPIYERFWSRYADAFATAGFGFGYTWFSRWHGIRIDHILTGPGWRCRRCRVGPDIGSDHRPVIADLEWIGGPN